MSVSQIRWRGPRPLTAGDILRGRDPDLSNLANKARNFDILEITAPSGVGKSSFIAAGLIPELRLAGMQVRPSRGDFSWSAVLTAYDETATADPNAELLYRLCLEWPTEVDDRSLHERFTELGGQGRPVVVLDQFEELIRYRKRLGEAFLGFIGRLAAEQGVTHVIAARSEFRDQFRPVEEACRSFFHWPLPEIDGEAALGEIITAPVVEANVRIHEDVVNQLRTWWTIARSDSTTGSTDSAVGRADVGLLHLQSVLWLFGRWLVREAPSTTEITLDHLRGFAREYVKGDGDEHGPRLYRKGLVEYIREHCASIHTPVEGAPHWSPGHRAGRGAWTNGPRLMMARSAHLLTVRGYKIAQSRSGMFHTVLAEDLNPAAVRAVAETASTATSDDWLTEVVDAQHESLEVEGKGVARGWSRDEVLMELLAAADHAWSAAAGEANILRRFVQKDDEVYELVHDGMGLALQEWASEEMRTARAVIGVITPRKGKDLDVEIRRETFLPSGDEVPDYWDGIASVDPDFPRQVRVNGLGWDASVITSPISEVVLEDWTLTGAAFMGCRIRDVVFRRCNLKGAAFLDVTMEGVRFEGCSLNGATVRKGVLSDVEFAHPDVDGTVADGTALDLFSFVGCDATGEGVSLRSLQGTLGLILDGVTGGAWRIQGTGIRHLALHADGEATFQLGPGTYEHITVEPAELVVEVDRDAVTEFSGISHVRDAHAR